MGVEFISNSPAETIGFGRRLGEQLQGGEVIALTGTLGTGKTHLIKGVAAGACGEDLEHDVHSPTFVLVNEYHGRLEVYHIDAYRLQTEKEFENIGFDDYCHPGAVVLVEWADRVKEALSDVSVVRIFLEHVSENQRCIRIENLPSYCSL